MAFGGAVALGAPSAGAWCRSRAGPGQPDPTRCQTEGALLTWRERCAGYVFDPRVHPTGADPEGLGLVVEEAARAWRTARCDPATGAPPAFSLAPLPFQDAPIGYLPGQRNVNTVAFRDRWGDDAHHREGTTALTVVTYDPATGQLFDADVELNLRSEANPNGYVFDAPDDPASADLPTVLTHEFGHAQGLAHSAERSAVMWFAAGRTFAQRALTADDEAAICAVAPPSLAVPCDPAEAGRPRPVAASSPGCRAAPPGVGGPDGRWALALLARRRRPRRRSS